MTTNIYDNELLEFINSNLITNKNKINNWASRESWWEKNQFDLSIYQKIINLTHFLDSDIKFTARIISILKGYIKQPVCSVCGSPTNYQPKIKDFSTFCSGKCTAIGTQEQSKKTCLEKYDKEYSFQSKNNINKSKETKRIRYNDENYNNAEKRKTTSIKIYGKDNPAKSQIIKNKISKNSKGKNKKFDINIDELRLLAETIPQYKIAEEYNASISYINQLCKKFDIPRIYKFTAHENELYNFIKSIYGGKIIRNSKKIIKYIDENNKKHWYELDIYLPELDFGIEYNGIYWHSSKYKDNNYHLNKTELCEEKGIQLFHIFENEWVNPTKQKIWKSMISNKLKLSKSIGARKCIVKEVDYKTSKEFLENNHLQGNCLSSIRYGLFYQDELVSLITIGKSRYNKNYEYELLRFCNKIGHIIQGGFSKLLKYFNTNISGSIISYANRRWSQGNLYKNNNFEELNTSKPNYFYVINGKLESRIGYQKHKLKDKLDIFDPELSEAINMKNNKFYKIYDSGNIVYGNN